MKKILETPEFEIYIENFQGHQVRISKSKITGKCAFNADDVAVVFGYKDHEHMMRDPEMQAKEKEYKKSGKSMFVEQENSNQWFLN